jgi:NADH-dependent peroxiredoxin subunit F
VAATGRSASSDAPQRSGEPPPSGCATLAVMLRPELRAQIAGHLELVRHRVQLTAALDDDDHSRITAELLDQLAGLSPMLSVTERDHPRRPSFAVERPGSEVAVRFAGPPTGDALSSLVLAVLHVGGHPPRIDDALARRIAGLTIPVELETWFATSCGSCGDTLHAFGVIGVLNPRMQHTAINGATFPDEAAARGVVSVPTVFINGERLTQGRMSVDAAVDVLEPLVA